MRRSQLISDLFEATSGGDFELPVRAPSLRSWLEYPIDAQLTPQQLPELSHTSTSHYKQVLEVRILVLRGSFSNRVRVLAH